jgi:hypothetical protein
LIHFLPGGRALKRREFYFPWLGVSGKRKGSPLELADTLGVMGLLVRAIFNIREEHERSMRGALSSLPMNIAVSLFCA